MMHNCNPYVGMYKQAFKKLEKNQELCMIIENDSTKDRRRYKAPSAPDVAAILPGDPINPRDIIVKFKDIQSYYANK